MPRHYEGFRSQKKVEQGGLIKLSGAFLNEHHDEVLNLVKHEGQDKITKIEKADNGFNVETSSQRVALHIAKRLEHAYKGKHDFKFREGEKYVEVRWSRD